jgi:hypothetical protein
MKKRRASGRLCERTLAHRGLVKGVFAPIPKPFLSYKMRFGKTSGNWILEYLIEGKE